MFIKHNIYLGIFSQFICAYEIPCLYTAVNIMPKRPTKLQLGEKAAPVLSGVSIMRWVSMKLVLRSFILAKKLLLPALGIMHLLK